MMEFFFLLKENYLISIVFILVISFALFVVYSIWRSRDKFEKGFVRTSMAILILFILITLYLMVFMLYIGFNRSEEHTSELQSRGHLVCRLLLEKKKL